MSPALALSLVLVLVFSIAAPVLAWWEASTTVNIEGPAGPVPAGSTVELTVTETNDGDAYHWISDVWVSLEPGGYILNKASGYYSGGDADDDGILDYGETWEWIVPVTVSGDTLFTAIGHGYCVGNTDWDVTYGILDDCGNMAFPNEKFELWVYVDGEGEGCTPGFWKNHLDAWVGYAPSDNFLAIFGAGPDISLLEAVNLRGGQFNSLVRHATAALLNAAHPDVDYPYSEGDIIAMVQEAYSSGEWEMPKNDLEEANELGCDCD